MGIRFRPPRADETPNANLVFLQFVVQALRYDGLVCRTGDKLFKPPWLIYGVVGFMQFDGPGCQFGTWWVEGYISQHRGSHQNVTLLLPAVVAALACRTRRQWLSRSAPVVATATSSGRRLAALSRARSAFRSSSFLESTVDRCWDVLASYIAGPIGTGMVVSSLCSLYVRMNPGIDPLHQFVACQVGNVVMISLRE